MLKKLISLCILIHFFYNVDAQKKDHNVYENTYTIKGFAHGYKDSSWLYLEDLSLSGKIIDSSVIIKEQFYFSSKKLLTVPAKQYILRTKSYSDYKYFWMEDKPVVFSGVKGKFTNAKINGSVTQTLSDEFQSFSDPLIIEIDSLKRNYGTTDPAMWNKILDLEKELKHKSAQFIERNNSSIISAYLLKIYCKSWGLTLTTQLYNKLTPENQKSDDGISINRFINLNKNIEVGKTFADFEQKSIDGNVIRLSSLKGNYILLEFWASWCGPCIRENPNLVKVYTKYKSRGFEIFGVSLDVSAMQWKKAIDKDALPWLNVSDLKGADNEAALIYGVYEIPSNFLIDPSGKIIAKNLRGENLELKLKELLGE
ncbi:MAG: AhpC/TSA family protein [Sediminibacterium sp.]|jgi:peroxiredoxin|uniref:TlpA disulfide reductase family protein n=1 Tax=unclassified Sediminibacterium TaxID=2635961 RepID=UPI001E1172A4|nr:MULTISPECIES: TlpA disulfide reductase family protein [unclassified Sediminibacterium]MBW0156163.1 AhpC/TSA family protein [Candidatus Methylopumilus sp.]MBW0164237.1 AhpC/TSA family protein [Sediminibacterium sp.]